MQLTLKYNPSTQQPTGAAIIQGTNSAIWLETLNQWAFDLMGLECFVLPTSRRDITASGLLVIFKNNQLPKDLGKSLAYGVIGQRLLIPVNSMVFPVIEDKELVDLLLFDWQLWHPTIGLIGFNQADQLNLVELIQIGNATENDWSYAQEGLPDAPRLTRISLPKLPPEAILQLLQAGIEKRPLSDIPGAEEKKEPKSIDQLMDEMRKSALKGGLSMADALRKAVGESVSKDGKDGLLAQFENWAGKRLADLEAKQKRELDRLMDLFEKDPDEALKYALPLDDKYKGRGTDVSTGWLSRRNTDFNLGGLGGGRRVASWNAGDRYYELRSKYMKTAREQMDKGNYRKAAYIYAHLLADYHSAAGALIKGKFYREAAALYLEHLNNKAAAARAYEEGGFLHEAIELYIELDKKEKVGDLYQRLGQSDEAIDYYQQCVSIALDNYNHLEAARLYNHKLADVENAKLALLDGWKGNAQQEACLTQYFDLVKQMEAADLVGEVQKIYAQYTPEYRQTKFLNVLLNLKRKDRQNQLGATAQNIAYEVISQQLVKGNTMNLNNLKNFVTDDQLLISDCSRFLHSRPKAKPKRQSQFSLQQIIKLPMEVQWERATTIHDQFVLLGKKDGVLHTIRGNWNGSLSRKSWSDKVQANAFFEFVDQMPATPFIAFYSIRKASLSPIHFPLDTGFYSTTKLHHLHWLPSETKAVAMLPEERVAVLEANQNGALLKTYNLQGDLKTTVNCMLNASQPLVMGQSIKISKMYYRKGYFYLYNNSFGLIRMAADGQVLYDVQVRTDGYSFIRVARPQTALRLVLRTNAGCILYRPNHQGFNRTGLLFAQDFQPIDMAFVSGNGLVMVKDNQVRIYDDGVINMATKPKLITEFELKDSIKAILPVSKRNQCAFLTTKGQILIYQLKER